MTDLTPNAEVERGGEWPNRLTDPWYKSEGYGYHQLHGKFHVHNCTPREFLEMFTALQRRLRVATELLTYQHGPALPEGRRNGCRICDWLAGDDALKAIEGAKGETND